MNTPTGPENIAFDIGRSRNSIIDNFILASSAFGFVYMSVTLWRDMNFGIISINSIVNLIMTAIPTVLWFARHRLAFGIKASILFVTYFIGSLKSLLLFGTYSNSTLIFSCFCCIILATTSSYRWSFVASFLLSLIIPVRAYLHITGIYPMDVSVVQISADNPASWLQLYVTFLLVASIVIVGTGKLRLEVYKYIGLLHNSIGELESTNKLLKQEIELKNVYEESLLVSSKKFQGLFDGSRDGVLLLDGNAQVMEANQTILDITGYSLQELKEINIFQLIDERFRKNSIQRFYKNVSGESRPRLDEIVITTKEGKSIPAEVNSNVIVSDDEVMVLSTIRDISYRKQIENEKFIAALEAEERERERFSKDLHDDLGPAFSTLILYLQTLNKKETDEDKKKILDKLSDIVDVSVKQVREISHNLSPYLLKDAGLVKAMATHLAKIKDNEALRVEFVHHTEQDLKTPHNVEVVLYRIFLELLNNTIKHSGADVVKISLDCSSQKFCFIYIDNGRGFDLSHELESKTGIGLRNIENRVKSLGGKIDFTYEKNEMITTISIPA